MSNGNPVELRFLSQEDALAAGLIDMDGCVETMEYVFELYNRGHVKMGNPGQDMHGHVTSFSGDADLAAGLEPGPDRRFSAMPAYVGGEINAMGIKWYGSNVTNPEKRDLPRSIHTITLNDPNSCKPVCIMDGQAASAMRTGAVTGVGARQILGDRATTATIVGPGVIGQTATLGLDRALDSLETIRIHHPEVAKAEAFREEMLGDVEAEIVPDDSPADAISSADVTVVAATGSPPPKVRGTWLKDDSLVIPLGDARLSVEAFDRDRIFCDIVENTLDFAEALDWQAFNAVADAVGDSIDRLDLRTLHELVGGEDTEPTDGRSIFYSPGLPMEDVAWASEVYERAEEEDLGQTVTMFSEPFFSKPY
jgi:ornithine cyclodeaminase